VIAARGLSRRFGSRVAIDKLTFDVSRREIVALLGPNGAGKTTTMRILAGLIAPSEGTVSIDGVALTRGSSNRLRRQIGLLTESPGLWDRLTVRENLLTYARLYELSDASRRVDQSLEQLGMTGHAGARAAELSKGMRQKVALARALLHEPAVLLLDEPTSGLDPEVTRSVRQMLDDRRASGCAILVSTHNLDEAERLADRVAVLHTRLLAIDRPSALRQRLTTGRILIRVGGDPSTALDVVRRFDPRAALDAGAIVASLKQPERQTPELVRALASAQADVLEVRPDVPALEDVYLRLMHDEVAS
jgi:ABC-2 type transport system ATP-binding protein